MIFTKVAMRKRATRVGRMMGMGGIGGMIVAALAPYALSAQTVGDDTVPPVGLNIPKNVQVFGKLDPNVRKPTAIVNGSVITGTDVDQRVAFIVNARELKLSAADMEQLKLQVLRSVIDETLQIQQAVSSKVKVTPDEINKTYDAFAARQFGKDPAAMRVYLRSIGSSERSLKRQVEAEMSWNRYLRREVEVNVSDAEVNAVIKQQAAAQGTEEYHLREIFLRSDGDRGQEVLAQMQQMLQSIQKRDKGEDTFGYYAHNFSQASTAAVDGDLGWLNQSQLAQLPTALTEAVKAMTREHLAGPIEVPGGYSLIYLVDTRKIGVADPRDSRLMLKQLSVRFPAGIKQEEANTRVSEFAKLSQGIHGCGDVAKVAATIGADVVDNDSVRIKDLPGPLQDIMLNLRVGESTPPFGSPTDGIRSLVLCGREDPKGAQLPSFQQIQSERENSRVSLRANQMMRDLRRDAIIEYR